MKTLENIYKPFGDHSDKGTKHSYIECFYEDHFSKYRDKSIKLLEMGICHGASLIYWDEYFDKCEIWGIDITFNTIIEQYKNQYKEKNITIQLGSAIDEKFLNKLPNFDIIIDDASHLLEHQIKTLQIMWPKLKKNGIYVIEDISNINKVDSFDFIPNKQVMDLRNNKNKSDDVIVYWVK